MKAKPSQNESVQRKLRAECKKLRTYLTESVSIYNELAAMLDIAAIEIREVPRAKPKRRRK